MFLSSMYSGDTPVEDVPAPLAPRRGRSAARGGCRERGGSARGGGRALLLVIFSKFNILWNLGMGKTLIFCLYN